MMSAKIALESIRQECWSLLDGILEQIDGSGACQMEREWECIESEKKAVSSNQLLKS